MAEGHDRGLKGLKIAEEVPHGDDENGTESEVNENVEDGNDVQGTGEAAEGGQDGEENSMIVEGDGNGDGNGNDKVDDNMKPGVHLGNAGAGKVTDDDDAEG